MPVAFNFYLKIDAEKQSRVEGTCYFEAVKELLKPVRIFGLFEEADVLRKTF